MNPAIQAGNVHFPKP